jgi:streptomycin 3"-adenylyltransferase
MAADQVGRLVALIGDVLGDAVEAVYLYGSAVEGGLKPASDLDLLAVTSRRTAAEERRRLVDGLRPISSRAERPYGWRPVELTIVARPDMVPWRHPPRTDFQSGEWLRAAFDAGKDQPWRDLSPDLTVLLAQVRKSGRPLIGGPATQVLPEVPDAELSAAMREEIPGLLSDLDTDTANVLLTLARIWYTLETGDFAPKDVAADWALKRLPPGAARALEVARDAYLGRAAGRINSARLTADELIGRIGS